jgi:hypothetical protein
MTVWTFTATHRDADPAPTLRADRGHSFRGQYEVVDVNVCLGPHEWALKTRC